MKLPILTDAREESCCGQKYNYMKFWEEIWMEAVRQCMVDEMVFSPLFHSKFIWITISFCRPFITEILHPCTRHPENWFLCLQSRPLQRFL